MNLLPLTSRLALVILLLTSLTTLPVVAWSITVPNPSFETPSTPTTSQSNFNLVSGWVFHVSGSDTFGTAAINSNFLSTANSTGKDYVFIDNNTKTEETITSASSLGTITPLTQYTLTVAVGNVKASDGIPNGQPGDVSFSLLANGVVFATEEVPNGTVANGDFQDFTLTYLTPATGSIIGENLTIQLASLGQGSLGYQAAFDNVTLDAIPEPRIAAMLLAGLVTLGWLIRRKTVSARIQVP